MLMDKYFQDKQYATFCVDIFLCLESIHSEWKENILQNAEESDEEQSIYPEIKANPYEFYPNVSEGKYDNTYGMSSSQEHNSNLDEDILRLYDEMSRDLGLGESWWDIEGSYFYVKKETQKAVLFKDTMPDCMDVIMDSRENIQEVNCLYFKQDAL